MATQQELDDLKAKTAALNQEASLIEKEASQLNSEAQSYTTKEQSALSAAAQATSDANEIRSKITSLESTIASSLTAQQTYVDGKAQSVLETAKGLIGKLETKLETVSSNLKAHEKYASEQFAGIYNILLKARCPVSGKIRPVTEILYLLFGLHRESALTAGEYDALNLSAQAYGNYNLTALMYDLQAKTTLLAVGE